MTEHDDAYGETHCWTCDRLITDDEDRWLNHISYTMNEFEIEIGTVATCTTCKPALPEET